ncbi:MAG: immunoglobulin domain-containing protein [Verrucomicrobia bacterium]|nr:immunoglobulin domain-containing protein [Verrucomicrobiota bacterium]
MPPLFRPVSRALVHVRSLWCFLVLGFLPTLAQAQAPVFTTVPSARQVVTINQNLTLTVAATGATSFQWKRNGLPIAGATNASHTITAAKPYRDNGWYQAVATNTSGSTTSAVVFVNVAVNPANIAAWGNNADGQATAPTGLANVVSVSAGYRFSIALTADGTVAGWGANENGQRTAPAGLTNVVAVAAGGEFSFALKSDGTVVAWGSNFYGQTAVPTGLASVVAIAGGFYHCLALKSDGTVVAWGRNGDGQTTVPTGLTNVVGIAGGTYHSLALKSDGTVVAWGRNDNGQVSVPAGLTDVVALAGGGHSLALKSDGTVVAWGDNFYRQGTVPAGLANVVAIAGSTYNSLALKSDGGAVAWGLNTDGQATVPNGLSMMVGLAAGRDHALALRDATADVAPIITAHPIAQSGNLGQSITFSVVANVGPVPATYQWRKDGVTISGATAASFTVGETAAATAGNYDVVVTNYLGSATSNAATLTVNPSPVVSATNNGRYVIGTGQSLTLTLDPAISSSATVQWKRSGLAIASATGRSLALTNASATASGYYQAVYNDGSGAVTSAPIFVRVAPATTQVVDWGNNSVNRLFPAGLSNAVSIGFVIALKADGTVVVPGSSYAVPADLTNVVAMDAGGAFLALRADGRVVAWGDNFYGQTNIPTGLATVVSVATRYTHCLALKSDGTVVSWGDPTFGGTAVPSGLAGVAAISAGASFSLALKQDGTVVGWGKNDSGQCSVPAGLSNVVAISAGYNFGLALKSDGTVVSWGANGTGPAVLPPGLSGVVAIAAGGSHALALRSDGSVIAWGTNGSGETTVPAGLNAVVGVAAGGVRSLALRDSSGDLAPTITTQPASVTAFAGQSLTLAVTASGGTSLPAYQWRKNGVALAGATTATLALANLSSASAGGYDVVVSNQLGSITSQVATVTINTATAVTLNLTGQQVLSAGQNLTLTATAAIPGTVTYQWRRNGRPLPGATNASYAISGATWRDTGAYQVVATNSVGPVTSAAVFVGVSAPTQVLAWGDNSYGQSSVPAGLTNVMAVAAGYNHSIAIKSDGTLVAWGQSSSGQTNPPGGLTGVVAAAAGSTHSMALRADGTVTTWGSINYTPSGLANVVAVASGGGYAMALKTDGTITAWTSSSVATDVPAGLNSVTAIAAGDSHRLALKSDGAVVGWGSGSGAVVPAGLAGVTAIACGYNFALALKADGTVVAWGDNGLGQATVPAGLANVVTIGASGYTSYAVKADGSVVAWGSNSSSLTSGAAAVTNVFSISGGSNHVLALRDASNESAPFITTHPVAQAAQVGQTVSMAVVASGATPLSYQWRKDGAAITGETNASLTLSNIQLLSAGSYDVVVTNSVGAVTSSAATLTVSPGTPPTISVQPVAQTALVGQSVTLSVAATGTAPFTYQWRKDGVAVAFATSASFSMFGVQLTNAGSYDVVVTNAAGSVTSNAAAVTVQPGSPPVITSQPQGGTVIIGGLSNFVVIVSSSTSVTYQWRFNGAAIAGAISSAYTIGSTALTQAGTYDVVVTNAGGSVTSQAAVLVVNQPTPPTIAGQPMNATQVAGGNVSFSVLSYGPPPFTIQWRKSGVAIAGATNATLLFSSVKSTDAGTYDVVITNSAGSVTSSSAVLTVTAAVPPSITSQPVSTTQFVGGTVSFSVGIFGTAPFTYQWRKNGTVIPGATSSTFSIGNVQTADAGNFDVVVTNAAGTVTSATAVLTTTPAVAPTITVQPVGATLNETNLASFRVTATGSAPLGYQWRKDGVPIADALYSTLALGPAVPSHAGTYDVLVTNAAGSVASSPAVLVVNPAGVTITAQPVGLATYVGTTVVLAVSATGSPSSPTYQWRKNGSGIAGATNSSLTFSPAQLADAGSYDVVVANSYASVTSSSATLVVTDTAPQITVQPSGGTLAVGGSLTVSVAAVGTVPFTYQWRRDGVALTGATNATLTIGNAQTYDRGDYTVVVTNALGSATSSAARVNVVPRVVSYSARLLIDGDGALGLFTIEGSVAKKVLLRAVGPGLAPFGLTGLGDPKLELFDSTGNLIAVNDDWSVGVDPDSIPATTAAVGAFALSPGSKDAAIVRTLAPGTYTVRALPATGAAGLGYLELHDADLATAPMSTLPYVAIRGRMGAGGGVVIGGLGANGRGQRSYLVRSVGPALGLAGALTNPAMLVVRDGTLIGNNDDWDANATEAAATTTATARVATFALPAGSRDAALVLTGNLHAGASTVQVSAGDNIGGTVLLELHDLDAARPASFAPAIVSPPVATTAAIGSPVALRALASGTGPLNFQWRKDGVPVSGATGAVYALATAAATDGGSYSVVVSNALGAATSLPATLTVVSGATGSTGAHAVVGGGYAAGGTVTITNTFTFPAGVSALGWTVTLPVGWSFASDAGTAGDIKPVAGDSGTLNWAWSGVPVSPATFAYTLNVPAGTTGPQLLAATASLRLSGSPQSTAVTPSPLSVVAAPRFHSADTMGTAPGTAPDNRLSLAELLRVIELYNYRAGTVRTGQYTVQSGTEDGYTPGPGGATITVYHSADTVGSAVGTPPDGKLNLAELLRVIELYNYRQGTVRTGQYHVQSGTEDGFAPGP